MRYFSLLDFQTVVLLTFLGLAVFVLLYIAFGGSVYLTGRKEKEGEKEEYPGGIEVGNRPIPPLLVFIYVAFVVWALAYVIVIGLRGGPF